MILKEGVEVWNAWRTKDPNIDIDLSERFLSQIVANLSIRRMID